MIVKFNSQYKLHKICSKDKDRLVLGGVFIHKKGDTVRAVATDGKRLTYVPVKIEGEFIEGCIIPAKAWATAVGPQSLFTQKKMRGVFDTQIELVKAPETGHLCALVRKRDSSMELHPLVDGKYPDYELVIPQDQSGARTCVEPDFWAECLEAMGGGWLPLISGQDELNPAIVKGKNGELSVIMPRRVE